MYKNYDYKATKHLSVHILSAIVYGCTLYSTYKEKKLIFRTLWNKSKSVYKSISWDCFFQLTSGYALWFNLHLSENVVIHIDDESCPMTAVLLGPSAKIKINLPIVCRSEIHSGAIDVARKLVANIFVLLQPKIKWKQISDLAISEPEKNSECPALRNRCRDWRRLHP